MSFQRFIGFPTTVIYLSVSEAVMKDRLKKRGNFDDTEESINKRVATFLEKTKPLIEKWNHVTVNAEGNAADVFAEIEAALDKEHALNLCEVVKMA